MRQGLKPLSDSDSESESDISEPLQAVLEQQQKLIDCPSARQGINSLANSESPLKWTKESCFSPLERTCAMRQGFQPL
ncbi:hypothetical protein [Microcoleus sp. PH2017_22_RUC_O_B]|uniref:hypothetical protein n=1 Tax=Microcoleus sp. PH2017_22_RUC_O_B TaxID=2798833 RepID=UPI0025E425A0|nr:hypothetical protein [Microcoleus sp. PH2017_22_RUC_O_B]